MARKAELLGVPNYTRVASAIRQDIVDGVLENDRRLTTMELAETYGLSLAPIREALLQLSAEGIVVIHPKRGAVVRAVTPDFLRDVYEVRIGLIPHIEGTRAALASDLDIQRMKAAEEAYEAAVEIGAREDVIRLNIDFHRALNSVRPNPQSEQILGRHHLLIMALRNRYGFSNEHKNRAVEEHRGLILAFEARSTEMARKISQAHLEHAFDELLALMKRGPLKASGSEQKSAATTA